MFFVDNRNQRGTMPYLVAKKEVPGIRDRKKGMIHHKMVDNAQKV